MSPAYSIDEEEDETHGLVTSKCIFPVKIPSCRVLCISDQKSAE